MDQTTFTFVYKDETEAARDRAGPSSPITPTPGDGPSTPRTRNPKTPDEPLDPRKRLLESLRSTVSDTVKSFSEKIGKTFFGGPATAIGKEFAKVASEHLAKQKAAGAATTAAEGAGAASAASRLASLAAAAAPAALAIGALSVAAYAGMKAFNFFQSAAAARAQDLKNFSQALVAAEARIKAADVAFKQRQAERGGTTLAAARETQSEASRNLQRIRDAFLVPILKLLQPLADAAAFVTDVLATISELLSSGIGTIIDFLKQILIIFKPLNWAWDRIKKLLGLGINGNNLVDKFLQARPI